ncbi:SusC/RagA family TonB-linked outer membrane protein [Mucilaginibacter sp. X5P1]|uniref:SusC/RagA family TonB-linked outer membrane protein n=1 Tax=Mucilaginibacter sp. X5P1 TaxID=2723088 RepID=UPI00161B2A6E|nr:SusC/RagA family TonB-linked outer membrane protein [Mucilaginibacter sp. X5P1]MBB6139818.1 iron complex outermembrane receptor protein [Mucilaginibacter sp. X5P1]
MKKTYLIKYVFLLFFVLSTATVFAQTSIITGKVVDETNQPLPGAAVTLKGTQKSTGTDANGNFRLLAVPNGTVTLEVTFIGYQTIDKVVNVSGNVTVDFDLVPSARSLNEVVVIGYGTEKKKDLTGSIATVTAKDFNQGAITTPEQLIQGKVAGVSITSNSGAPGAGSTITIRGGASLNGGNDPLIVLDGMPLSSDALNGAANPLDLINPNDIASFSILKDASASAIYGNRASNGVIIITTKKGQSGKPVINFSTQFSVATLPKEASVLSASQFRNYVKANGDSAQIATMGTANTDWQKQIYQTALGTDNNLSVSGTAGILPYRVSVGYSDQNGILKTTSMQRYTTNVNLSPSFFTNHLKVNFNFIGSQTNNRFANNQNAIIGDAATFDPTQPVKSSNALYTPYGGYWQWTDPSSQNGLKQNTPGNPVALLEQTNDHSTAYRGIASLNLDYKFHFFPDLHANVNLGYDESKSNGSTTIPADAASNYLTAADASGKLQSGAYTPYNAELQNKLFEGYFSYSKDIKSIKSHFDAVAGYSIQDFKNTASNGLFPFISNGSTLYSTTKFANGEVNPTAINNYNNYEYLINEFIMTSFYGRFNYNYDEKYYLTASIRSDNSTKFAPGTRTGTFPSVALAWKINNEDFLKGTPAISTLKLRVEYGVTGNQEGIGEYDYLSQYSLSTSTAQYNFGGTNYQLYRPGAYYPGRTWETTDASNIGLDYGFINDRITGSIDYYYNKTKNLLATIGQPALTNFGNQIVGNVGNMENNGLEFSINADLIDTKTIGWTANFNVSFNHNKITNLTSVADLTGISGGTGNYVNVDQVGYARNSFNVYQQVYGPNGKPLDGVFVDRNGDGSITVADRYNDHSPDPKQIFGFSSDFRYEKWNIGFVTRANLGNYVYNNVASSTGTSRNILNPIGNLNNGSTDVLTSGLTGNGANDLLSDYYIQNGSFFRMDNAHIGYNFGKVFKGTGDLKISANVQNVFIITDYKGVDPEIPYTGTTGVAGVDNNFYPRPRTYVLGLNLSLR